LLVIDTGSKEKGRKVQRVVFEGSRDKGTGREMEKCPSFQGSRLTESDGNGKARTGTRSGLKSDRAG
jgi:hypothetical protein